MPQIDYRVIYVIRNNLIAHERTQHLVDEETQFESLFGALNPQQRNMYDSTMESIRAGKGGLFFVYGCGGTGKTYSWKTMISRIRSRAQIVLVVAALGIASLLMPGGRIAHSRFHIPIDLNHDS